jgi:hypothetical protein
VLLLQIVLGLVPGRAEGALRSEGAVVPEWLDGVVLDGVRAFGQAWTVRVDGDAVLVEPTE